MTHQDMDSGKMLDAYIHDYLLKRKFNTSSKTFQAEADVPTNFNVIDAPDGFLFEWWSVFWDTFIARYKGQVSGTAVPYNEGRLKAQNVEEQQQQQQQWHHKFQLQQQHMQMQELLQRQIQQQKQQQQLQQRRDEMQHKNGSAYDTQARQNPRVSNALATKMYQEGLKLLAQNDPSDYANKRLRYKDNLGNLLDSNHATILKSLAVGGQSSRHAQHADLRALTNEGIHNLPLKGWPLTGLDHLRPRLLQQQKPLMQSPLASDQLLLQRQLVLQAQENLPSSSANNLECTKLGMLLNEHYMGIGNYSGLDSVGDKVLNDGLMLQVGHPVLSRGDIDMLMKKQMQNSNQHQQGTLLSKQSQISDSVLHQQDKMICNSNTVLDASLSNTLRGNDQALKNQTGIKRKQPMSSSGPANSSVTASTTGPSPSSAPSTPSIHTTGDVISRTTLTREAFSNPSSMLGNNGGVTLTSATTQLAEMGCFVGNGSVDDIVESYPSHEVAEHSVGASVGFSFSEIGSILASAVDCCDLSSDGKLLVTGGNDKRAKLWCTDLREQKSTLEEHSLAITDICFSPITPWLATSSLDKTVRVWDTENLGYSLHTFVGHSASVMSLDFHPYKGDLICSCDEISEIRYWSITKGGCARVSKGGSTQVRFQPSLGRYIAAVLRNGVSIIDVETAQTCGHPFQVHSSNIASIGWDISGEHLATVNEDVVRVWKIGAGAQRDCIHELSVLGKKFRCCVFHPHYPSLLVIGCAQSLELWNIAENKMMTPLGEPVAALAASKITGLVASACQDNHVKMWK